MSLFKKRNTEPEEYASVIEWTPQWSSGAPLPQVFSDGKKTFLIYLIEEPYTSLDETDVKRIDNSIEEIYALALVEFSGSTFRFGIANDEVFSGLPLWGKGLEAYAAHLIENSSWISELKQINKVHPTYNEDSWKNQKHFVLLFHDQIFEVITTQYKIETHKTSFRQLATEVVRRMYE